MESKSFSSSVIANSNMGIQQTNANGGRTREWYDAYNAFRIEGDEPGSIPTVAEALEQLPHFLFCMNKQYEENGYCGMRGSNFMYACDYADAESYIAVCNIPTTALYKTRWLMYKGERVCQLFVSQGLRAKGKELPSTDKRIVIFGNLMQTYDCITRSYNGEYKFVARAFEVAKDTPRGVVYCNGRVVASAI